VTFFHILSFFRSNIVIRYLFHLSMVCGFRIHSLHLVHFSFLPLSLYVRCTSSRVVACWPIYYSSIMFLLHLPIIRRGSRVVTRLLSHHHEQRAKPRGGFFYPGASVLPCPPPYLGVSSSLWGSYSFHRVLIVS